MLPSHQLARAIREVKTVSVHGPWSRIVAVHHLFGDRGQPIADPRPLWGGAARIHGARFTPKAGFDSVYLTWDPITALAEVHILAIRSARTLTGLVPPSVLLSVTGVITPILDLTDPDILHQLGTNEQEITGAWQLSLHPPTQVLGRTAFDSDRIAGIKYPSARNIGQGNNLVVFPDRLSLAQNNFLQVRDPHGNLSQRIAS